MVSIQSGPTSTPQHPETPSPKAARSRFQTLAASIAALLLAVAPPALAGTNLLANPDFPDQILNPWTVDSNGEIYWSAVDVAGATNSGSLLIVDNVPFFGPWAYSECVPVSAGAAVQASGFFRKGSGAPSSARMELRVAFYSTFINATSCSGGVSEIVSELIEPNSSWSMVDLNGTAPAGAAGMRMRILASSGTSGTELFELHGDALSLSHEGALPSDGLPFVDGFESGDTAAWSQVTSGN